MFLPLYGEALITFTPMTFNGSSVFEALHPQVQLEILAESSQGMMRLKSRQSNYLIKVLEVDEKREAIRDFFML